MLAPHILGFCHLKLILVHTAEHKRWTHTATTEWPQKDSKWPTWMQFRKYPASNGCCCLSLMLIIVLFITCTNALFQVELLFSRPLTPDLHGGMGCSWITEKVTTWMGGGNLRSICKPITFWNCFKVQCFYINHHGHLRRQCQAEFLLIPLLPNMHHCEVYLRGFIQLNRCFLAHPGTQETKTPCPHGTCFWLKETDNKLYIYIILETTQGIM